jgi:hypothetical protein
LSVFLIEANLSMHHHRATTGEVSQQKSEQKNADENFSDSVTGKQPRHRETMLLNEKLQHDLDFTRVVVADPSSRIERRLSRNERCSSRDRGQFHSRLLDCCLETLRDRYYVAWRASPVRSIVAGRRRICGQHPQPGPVKSAPDQKAISAKAVVTHPRYPFRPVRQSREHIGPAGARNCNGRSRCDAGQGFEPGN